MNEIKEIWFEISLHQLINELSGKKIPSSVLAINPWTNFNIGYRYYSTNNSIMTVVQNIHEHFTLKSDEFTLELYIRIINANLHPDAKLRFKTNILEQINNFIQM